MVTLQRLDEPVYRCTTGLAALNKVANVQRLLPANFLDESGTMITPAFVDYALPLIGEPLPAYPRLKRTEELRRKV